MIVAVALSGWIAAAYLLIRSRGRNRRPRGLDGVRIDPGSVYVRGEKIDVPTLTLEVVGPGDYRVREIQ